MAQLSFFYDTVIFSYYFDAKEIPHWLDYLKSDIFYTLRVLAAWWFIKIVWDLVKNYWIAVLIGAETTFIIDFFIFKNLFV